MTPTQTRNILAVVAFIVAASSSPAHAQLERVTLGYPATAMSHFPAFVGREFGQFRDEGLDVQLVRVSGNVVVAALLAGELGYTTSGDGTVRSAVLGLPIKMLAAIGVKPSLSLIVRPEIKTVADLKGKAIAISTPGTTTDFIAREIVKHYGLNPERDITMVQTAGPAETVAAIASGKIHAAALSPPATLQAKKAKLRELLDMSKLDAEYHINGVVTTRKFLKTNEDTVRRFMRAYTEAAVRGQRDKAFAVRAMARIFRSDDRELLDESYDLIIKPNFVVPPHPSVAGVASLLKGLEPSSPKAKGSKAEDHVDGRIVRELEQSGFIKLLQQ